jgi:hypothetical protein
MTKPPGQLGGFFASVFARSAAKFANSQIQNRPLLDSKTEFNGVGGLRTYLRNCVGVVSIGTDLSPPCTRARSLMPRNFGFPKHVDPRDQWPLAIFVAVVLLIVAGGIFIA